MNSVQRLLPSAGAALRTGVARAPAVTMPVLRALSDPHPSATWAARSLRLAADARSTQAAVSSSTRPTMAPLSSVAALPTAVPTTVATARPLAPQAASVATTSMAIRAGFSAQVTAGVPCIPCAIAAAARNGGSSGAGGGGDGSGGGGGGGSSGASGGSSGGPPPGPPGDVSQAPGFLAAVGDFLGQTPSDVKAFYARMESTGIDYKGLITAAKTKHGLSDDEAHAIFGYTTKLFYRPLNEALEAGGNPHAEALSSLIKSGLQKMPASASPVQYRGWRFEGADKVAKEQAFDAKFKVGNDVAPGGFWSTGPDAADSYPGGRNVVINTTSAKDISDLAFGVHFHGLVGKPPYASETIIAPGTSFSVDGVDNSGPVARLMLNEN